MIAKLARLANRAGSESEVGTAPLGARQAKGLDAYLFWDCCIPLRTSRPTGSARADTRRDRLTDPVIAFHHLCQNTQEAVPIFVVLEDRLASVATAGGMIQGAGKFDAQGSGHAERLTEPLTCYHA